MVTLEPQETEAGFQAALREAAMVKKYPYYHTYDSRRSDPGFPDTAIVIPGDALILAELKSNAGRLSTAQKRWLDALLSVKRVETHVWRPHDWPGILHRLGLEKAREHGKY